MRVLDVGSGAGDVAFLAADLVGAGGEVVGTDRSPAALAMARQRADARSPRNVVFREGDPAEMTFDRPFDAVIGRYVLMFQRDPTAMIRALTAHARRGPSVARWRGSALFATPEMNVSSCIDGAGSPAAMKDEKSLIPIRTSAPVNRNVSRNHRQHRS